MKTILTTIILLAALSVCAEDKTQSSGAATNQTSITNISDKADARTGATHKWKQKVSP